MCHKGDYAHRVSQCKVSRRDAPYVAPVGATYDKLDFWQREKIWELRSKRVAGTEVARLLAKGWPSADPPVAAVKITPQAVNSAYRRMERDRNALYFEQIAHVPTAEVLALNRRKLSQIAAAEAERLRKLQEVGRLDAVQLGKLAGAVERIEKLEVNAANRGAPADPTPKPRGEDRDQAEQEKAPSFTDALLKEAAEREAELGDDSQHDADPAHSGPEPHAPAVPADPPTPGHS
jgi:hypothetical protein